MAVRVSVNAEPKTRLGYDPTRIDPGSILDRITKDRKDRGIYSSP
jgi:hypothetical protein